MCSRLLVCIWIAVPSLWAQLGSLTVTPSSLNFSYKIGDPNPPAQTLTVLASGSYQISVYSDPIEVGTGGWLVASQGTSGNPSVITVYARPKGYPPRTYAGRIVIDTAPSIPYAARMTLGVGLSVAPAGAISVEPSFLSFTTVLGSVPAPKQLSIAGSAAALPFATSVTSGPGNWLSINATGGMTPFNLVVQASSAGLAEGGYQGEISVWLIGSSSALRIPVNITIVQPPFFRRFRA